MMSPEREAVAEPVASKPTDSLPEPTPNVPPGEIELRVKERDEPLEPDATEGTAAGGIELRFGGQDEQPGPIVPEPNRGFSERAEATFIARVPKDSGLRLFVDDERLAPVDADDADEIHWKWTPGFYAGKVRARLADEGAENIATYWLDVSADPKKAGSATFEEMVETIYEFDRALLLGEEPAKRQMGAIGPTDDPLVLFERLRKRRDAISLALAAIRREPATVLRPRRRFTPLREVRRADLRTLRAALRSPQAWASLPAARAHGARLPKDDAGGPEPIFDTPDVERTRDSPANRTALVMLRALIRRSATLPRKLDQLAHKKEADTRTSLARRLPVWKEILQEMERGFRQAERRSPFSEVARAEVTAAGLNAVAAHPLYSRFWQISWAALRFGIDGPDRGDLLPLAPTWEIYERWCFVALARRLKKWLPDYSWYWLKPKKKQEPDQWGLVGHSGHRAVTLQLQTTFPSTKGEPGREGWAVTRERCPDLLLTIEKDGAVTRFVLLDSKYTAKSLLKHVGKTAHIYQDGLRWGQDALRPSATLILTPTTDEAPWLAEEAFIRKHRIGAVELRPDSGPPKWLRDFLLAPEPT